jgi:hypothetical protein
LGPATLASAHWLDAVADYEAAHLGMRRMMEFRRTVETDQVETIKQAQRL